MQEKNLFLLPYKHRKTRVRFGYNKQQNYKFKNFFRN